VRANEGTTFQRDCVFDDFFCSYNIHINKSETLAVIFISSFLTYPDPYDSKHADADQKEERWQHPGIQLKIRIRRKTGISTDFQLARKNVCPTLRGQFCYLNQRGNHMGGRKNIGQYLKGTYQKPLA